jgi:hypothetical protein
VRTVQWPAPLRAPVQPRELAGHGLCGEHPYPEMWTSSRSADREQAAAIWAWCPVLAACREWSAHLPWTDNTIYAGLGSKGRRQLRKAVQETVTACTEGDSAPSAA